MPGPFPSLLGPLPSIQQTPGLLGPGLDTHVFDMTPMDQPQMPQPPMPQPPQAPPQPPPSLWDRIQARLMPAPAGLDALLSPADLHAARGRGVLDLGLSLLANSSGTNGGNAPSLQQALAAGVGQMRDSYDNTLNRTLQTRSMGQQLESQRSLLMGRKAIGQFLQQNMTGDQKNDFAVLRKAYMMAASINDTESMKALSPLLEKDPGLTTRPPLMVPAGGDTMILDPNSLKPLADVKHTPSPVDPSVLDARSAARTNAQLQHENMFVNSYRADPDIKYGTSVAQVAGQLNALRPAALQGDPFAQFQALEAALRLRNPEMNRQPNPQDYKQLASSIGLVGRARKLLENYQQGTILPSSAMRRLYETSDNMVRQGKARYDAARAHYKSRLPVWGLDESLIPDVFQSVTVPREIPTNRLLDGEDQ